jgi:hypothetical protein
LSNHADVQNGVADADDMFYRVSIPSVSTSTCDSGCIRMLRKMCNGHQVDAWAWWSCHGTQTQRARLEAHDVKIVANRNRWVVGGIRKRVAIEDDYERIGRVSHDPILHHHQSRRRASEDSAPASSFTGSMFSDPADAMAPFPGIFGSWGLDRLNQADLPLDSVTRDSGQFPRAGEGTHVYVLDTGCFAGHEVFSHIVRNNRLRQIDCLRTRSRYGTGAQVDCVEKKQLILDSS